MRVIADKPIRVTALSGVVITLQPNVERTVSDEIGILLLQEGATQIGKEESATSVAAPAAAEEAVAEAPLADDGSDILEAIANLVEVGDPNDFKADGTPKAAALNKVVGRSTTVAEREAAWSEFLNT